MFGPDAQVLLVGAAMFGLMAIGIPIFMAIGVAAFAGLWMVFGFQQGMVDFVSFLWQSLNSFELVTIPLFVLAAMLVQEAEVGDEMFDFAKVWVGSTANGLGVAVILTCAIFAGITGSSPVTAVTVGLIALPALAREGYPESTRGALVSAGGTLGILLPPSVPLIIYGVITQTSIGSLFVATIIPGLSLALLFRLYMIFFARPRPRLKALSYNWAQRTAALRRAAPVVILPVFIVLSIYPGLVNQEIAQIHPPAGLNLVTVSSISGIPLTRMMLIILPFIAIELVMIYLLYFFPALTLYLPAHMMH